MRHGRWLAYVLYSVTIRTNIGAARVCVMQSTRIHRNNLVSSTGVHELCMSKTTNANDGYIQPKTPSRPSRVHSSLAIPTLPDRLQSHPNPYGSFRPTGRKPHPIRTSDAGCNFRARWLNADTLRPRLCTSSTLRYAGMSCSLLTYPERLLDANYQQLVMRLYTPFALLLLPIFTTATY